MAFETLKFQHVGDVPRVPWDCPPPNAVSTKLMTETLGTFDSPERCAETRRIVLTGAGSRAFSAGIDLSRSD